jgi:hypothetical protein
MHKSGLTGTLFPHKEQHMVPKTVSPETIVQIVLWVVVLAASLEGYCFGVGRHLMR